MPTLTEPQLEALVNGKRPEDNAETVEMRVAMLEVAAA